MNGVITLSSVDAHLELEKKEEIQQTSCSFCLLFQGYVRFVHKKIIGIRSYKFLQVYLK